MDINVVHHRGQIITTSSLVLLAGIWLIISPYVLHFHNVLNATAIDGFFGVLICVMAVCRLMGPYVFPGISWTNVLFGVWILVSPFCVGFYHFPTPLVNNIISGVIVVGLATWSAVATVNGSHMPTDSEATITH